MDVVLSMQPNYMTVTDLTATICSSDVFQLLTGS